MFEELFRSTFRNQMRIEKTFATMFNRRDSCAVVPEILHFEGKEHPYRRKDHNRRLRVEITIRAIAIEFTVAWQSYLRAKMAIHGSASDLNRIKRKIWEWK